MSRRTRWAIQLAAGLLVFWIAFHDVDGAALAAALAQVDPLWLAAAAGSVFLTVACIVARWRVLLAPAGHPAGNVVLFSAVIASQVANIVMPFKLGDAVRIGAVARSMRVPPAEVLASVAVERLYDAALVAIAAALLAAGGALPPFAFAGMLSLSLTMTSGVALLVGLSVWPEAYRRLWRAVSPLAPARVRARAGLEIERLARGVARSSRPRTIGAALALSACVMGGSTLTAALVAAAFGFDLPSVAAAVLVIVLQIGNAVVPVPGAVGISQVLTVQTLELWQVGEARALAFALVLYLVARVPKMIVLPLAIAVLAPGRDGAA